MIAIAKYTLIVAAVMLSPIYVIWIFGGRCADRRGQRRSLAMMKGN